MKQILISILMLPLISNAQLQLASVFSNNMVLQREQPVHIWGKGMPGEKITALFSGQSIYTWVLPDSTWHVYFKKQKANNKPQTISFTNGKEQIVLKNILIGDIWICSGQSNMEWEMQKEQHWQQEKLNSRQPFIRFLNPPPVGRNVFGVGYTDSLNRRLTTDGFYLWNGWKECDSSTVKTMSAVAYYYALSIVKQTAIPVGLINLSIGGAPAETFIRKEAMLHSKQFASKVKGNWLQNDALPVWVKERGKQNVGSNVNGYKDDLGLNHAYKPGFAYESGIVPLLPLAIKGIIWYQGESNAQEIDRVNEYAQLISLMVKDYRHQWKQPKMPFYFVQLSSIDTLKYKGQLWPRFRDEQRKMLQLIPYSGMAVCSDIGAKNDVHPGNKKTVGERLAVWALRKTYKKKLTPSGPLPTKLIVKNNQLILSFAYIAKGLKTMDGKALRGFSVDGKNEVQASILHGKVLIKLNSKPEYLYYGWQPFSDANLANSDNLPASSFKLSVN